MKFTNVKQLIIKFMGGGLINFPTRFLRWVKINGDSDGSDGGSDTDVNQELTFLNQVSDLIYQTHGFMFDDDDNGNYAVSISDYEDSMSEGTTILGNKENADYVLFLNGEGEGNTYTVFLTEEEYNYLENTVDVQRNYFRDWTKNKFAFPINSYLSYDGSSFHVQDGAYTENGNVIPNLFGYIQDDYIYGLKLEDIGILGAEFCQNDWNEMFETPDTKFTFNIPSEGIYSGFVFARYDYLSDNYQNVRTNLNNLPQKIYKAGETDFDEIYLVQLIIGANNSFFTIYVKSKTNDWV